MLYLAIPIGVVLAFVTLPLTLTVYAVARLTNGARGNERPSRENPGRDNALPLR